MSRELYVPDDAMVLRLNPRLADLHDAVRPMFVARVQACYKRGVPVRVVSTYRSLDEQTLLFRKGRALVGENWVVVDPDAVVTNAEVGWHNFGLAADVAILENGRSVSWEKADRDGDGIEDWIEIAEATVETGHFDPDRGEVGFYWRSFSDPPHAERHRGLDLATALDRVRGGFDVVSGKRAA